MFSFESVILKSAVDKISALRLNEVPKELLTVNFDILCTFFSNDK